ncbi:MAG: DNA primase [Thermaerobacter sp.]|nr:DNA primase [Thermaerobacter sp.]
MPFRAEGLDELRRRIDIAAVVGQTVALRRQGARLVGLCPFHSEKSPSFSVSPERGLFYCFGCHAGGDAIDFVMRRDSLSFRESVEILAQEFGVQLPEENVESGEAAQRQERRAKLLKLMEAAQALFASFLLDDGGEGARSYLAGRGLHAPDAKRFDLGYAPGDGQLLQRLKAPQDLLMEAGLAVRHESGRVYERFRDRVTFAIRDRAGRIVGFGGRTMGDGQPKYLNSPETPLFHKGSILYAWPWGQRTIQEERAVTLCEGYMDAIALHRGGFAATVATLGTALTEEHARQIGRVARRAYLAFDTDNAGKMAVRRSVQPLLAQGLEVLVVSPPEGKDPDELLRAKGPEAWREALVKAEPVTAWLYSEAVAQYGVDSPAAKAHVTEEVFSALRALQSPLVRDEELRRLALRLEVREEALRAEFQHGRAGDRTHTLQNPRNSTRNTAVPPARPDWLLVETTLLSLVALYPDATSEIRGACRPLKDPSCEAALALAAAGDDPAQSEDEGVRRAWAEASLAETLPREEIAKAIARWTLAGKRERLNEVNRIILEMQEAGQPIDSSLMVESHQLSLETERLRRG